MKITYLGHASLLLEINSKKIIFDPFITGNTLAKHIDINTIDVDYIFLTHAHLDHILDVEVIVKNNPKATLVSNYEIVTYYQERNINGHPLNHGGKHKFDFGMVKFVNSIHSSTFPDGSNGGNPGGFVIYDDSYCIYIAGDTALTMDMKLIPMVCPKLDLAILPIGDNFTMGYQDALIASDFIQCSRILGCHFNTFDPIKINSNMAIDHFKKSGKELILIDIGQSITI